MQKILFAILTIVIGWFVFSLGMSSTVLQANGGVLTEKMTNSLRMNTTKRVGYIPSNPEVYCYYDRPFRSSSSSSNKKTNDYILSLRDKNSSLRGTTLRKYPSMFSCNNDARNLQPKLNSNSFEFKYSKTSNSFTFIAIGLIFMVFGVLIFLGKEISPEEARRMQAARAKDALSRELTPEEAAEFKRTGRLPEDVTINNEVASFLYKNSHYLKDAGAGLEQLQNIMRMFGK